MLPVLEMVIFTTNSSLTSAFTNAEVIDQDVELKPCPNSNCGPKDAIPLSPEGPAFFILFRTSHQEKKRILLLKWHFRRYPNRELHLLK